MFRSVRQHSLRLALALAACIFLIDTLSSLQFSVASLYVLVVLLSAGSSSARHHSDRRVVRGAYRGQLPDYARFFSKRGGAIESCG